MVVGVRSVAVKPAGQPFQITEAGDGIKVKRIVQMGDQHLLTGVSELDVEDQVQHV